MIGSVDRTGLAVVLIVASVLLLSTSDAILKAVSTDYSLWQIHTLRSAFSLPVLLLLLQRGGIGRWVRIARPWVLVRSLVLVGAWLAYYTALPLIDLSVAATGFYTAPLFIAALSALFIGQSVGKRRLIGIALGFVGVLAVLRPGAADFSAWTVLPIAAAVFYALTAIITRTRAASESPLVLGPAIHVCLVAVGTVGSLLIVVFHPTPSDPFLLGPWTPMDARDWTVMAGLGVVQALSAVGIAKAYQTGAPVVIATFDYAYVVFAAMWGVAFFSEDLDALALSGMALIIAAGLTVLNPRGGTPGFWRLHRQLRPEWRTSRGAAPR